MATNSLTYYESLVEKGVSPKEASAHAHALDNYTNSLEVRLSDFVTKEDFRIGMQILEKDLKYFFISSFVGFIYAPIIVGLVIWWVSR